MPVKNRLQCEVRRAGEFQVVRPEEVRHPVVPYGLQAGVTEQDFEQAPGRWSLSKTVLMSSLIVLNMLPLFYPGALFLKKPATQVSFAGVRNYDHY